MLNYLKFVIVGKAMCLRGVQWTLSKRDKSIITDEGTIKLDCYRNLIPTSFVCGVCEKVVKKG